MLPETTGAGPRSAQVLLGGASAVIGLVTVCWPHATVGLLAVLFGVHFLVNGLVRMVQAFLAGSVPAASRVLLFLLGALSLVFGALCLRDLRQTVTVLTALVGAFWLVGGLVEVALAVTGRTRQAGVGVLGGLLGAVTGLVVLLWPAPTVLVLAQLLGLWLMLFGALALGAALRAGRRPRPA